MASSSVKFMCLFIIVGLVVPSLAADFDVPWWPTANLDLWKTDKIFHVGDNLRFVPQALGQLLDVIKVEFNAFLDCTGQGELLVKQAGGTECIYPLLQAGQLYFTAQPNYCLGGLKLNITVSPL